MRPPCKMETRTVEPLEAGRERLAEDIVNVKVGRMDGFSRRVGTYLYVPV
jgi:hypothetical protein